MAVPQNTSFRMPFSVVRVEQGRRFAGNADDVRLGKLGGL
jgi:hypothetical protein